MHYAPGALPISHCVDGMNGSSPSGGGPFPVLGSQNGPMHTAESLALDLEKSGIPRDATVLVHSSLRSIAPVEGGADAVCDALVRYFEPGLVVLPTHTWMTVNKDGAVFDPLESPSCVGALTEVFWQRPDTFRSWHPTHSVAAAGKDAEAFVADEHLTQTPCPRNGVYGKLADRDAYIAFVGCPMTKNTFVHGVEEWCGIPNRLALEPTALSVRLPGGEVVAAPQHMHKAPIEDISSNYGKLKPLLEQRGMLRRSQLGDAEVLVVKAREVQQVATQLLADDPDYFLTP